MNNNNIPILIIIPNKIICKLFAGDDRSNTHPLLTILQVILLRLHNLIAKELFELNRPKWDDEKTFQETRRIVNAITQHISFSVYAPNLIGR